MTDPLIHFSQDDYKIIKREVLYKGIFTLARYQLQYRTFQGGWSNVCSREILERNQAAAILPYDPVLDRVVLIQQFRIGAIEGPGQAWLVETIAGSFDPDEGAVNAAIRESEEEAGCKILDIHPICDYFCSPGGTNEYVHIFCGRVDASNIDGIYGLHEEEEDIRAFSLSIDEAFTLFQEGKIKTAPAITALLWLKLNHEWLKKLWHP